MLPYWTKSCLFFFYFVKRIVASVRNVCFLELCQKYLQTFSGTQNVSNVQKDEAWRVNVRIQGCDLDHGYLCGTMEALNVPMADTPVTVL